MELCRGLNEAKCLKHLAHLKVAELIVINQPII